MRSLAETEVVAATPAGWTVIDPTKVTIPESVKVAVEERVARLGETVQGVLVQAAVLGQEFGFAALRALVGGTDEDLEVALDRAVAARLLVDRSGVGEERFGFLDDQMQEVLYAGIPPLRRRRLHLRAAHALEEVYAGREDAPLDELARHFAGGNDGTKAAEYAWQAAEQSRRLFNWSRATALYERTIDLLGQLPETDDTRRRGVDAVLNLVNATYASEGLDQNLARLQQAEDLASALCRSGASLAQGATLIQTAGDRRRLALVQRWIGYLRYASCEYHLSVESLERALASTQALGDDDLALLASRSIGTVLVIQGYPERAIPLLADAIQEVAQRGSQWEWIVAAGYLALARTMAGDYAAGLAEGLANLARARALNDPRGLTLSHVYLVWVSFLGGDLPRTREAAEATRPAADQSGDRLWLYLSLGFHAWTESRLGDPAAAEAIWASFQALGQSIGHGLPYQDWWAAAAAEIALGSGWVEEALGLAKQAVTFAHAVGGLFAEGVAERVWGQALAAVQPALWDDAVAHLAASLRCFEEGGARLEAARTHVAWGRLLRDRGDPSAARDHLEQAAAQFEASGLTDELERTRALLTNLH